MSGRDTPEWPRGPRVLFAGGLDSSWGAGLSQDARVAERMGCHPVAVATALTVQTWRECLRCRPVGAADLEDDMLRALETARPAVVKIGLLGGADHAQALARALDAFRNRHGDRDRPVLYWDPVRAPTRGEAFMDRMELADMARALAPWLHCMTPNLSESDPALPWGLVPWRVVTGARREGRSLAHALWCHGTSAGWVERKMRDWPLDHGTGCAFASALACRHALSGSAGSAEEMRNRVGEACGVVEDLFEALNAPEGGLRP